MGIPYIAIILVMITVYVNRRAARTMRRDAEARRAFWEREHAANFTRKKPLDHLAYIRIPEDLPLRTEDGLPMQAKEAADRILRLREEEAKIVNLTGYTNTDLKLEYGTANITDLTFFDANYTVLATSLQECGKAFYENGRYGEAEKILEYAVQTETDITETYRLLTDIYRTKRMLSPEAAKEKISALLTVAKGLRALSRDGIVALLEEALLRLGEEV
ncbi:MAG: hypothetical protein IJQ12_04235 [Lachnospiraceae bacterium]|nr:hypothetical protein [Lachnospiraceae bacterium]